MTDSESVQWQPLSALAKVARDVDEQFTNTREQYEQLLRARDQPHLLDDAVVARVMRLVTDELEFLPVYREQLACWYQSQPTPGQFIELDRMTHQLDRWRELLQRQLALAQELNVGTIDKVLAKSDHELAAALLCGDMKFPPAESGGDGRRRASARPRTASGETMLTCVVNLNGNANFPKRKSEWQKSGAMWSLIGHSHGTANLQMSLRH